jgi:hypothetical protein
MGFKALGLLGAELFAPCSAAGNRKFKRWELKDVNHAKTLSSSFTLQFTGCGWGSDMGPRGKACSPK